MKLHEVVSDVVREATEYSPHLWQEDGAWEIEHVLIQRDRDDAFGLVTVSLKVKPLRPNTFIEKEQP